MATASTPPYVSNISSTPAGAQPSGWATKQDWTRHEGLIRQLYEQRTLPDLMQEMKSKYDFKAAVKMYKTRIAKWGLHKKIQRKTKAITAEDKPGVVHKKRHLTHPDESNDGCEDVIRHEKRRRIADVDAPSTALIKVAVVECLTPIASPIMMPGLLDIAESIFCSLRDYYKGSFERGTWVSDKQGLDCHSIKVARNPKEYLNALKDECMLACRLFATNRCQKAGQALIIATAGIKNIVEAEHPMTLSLLFGVLLNCKEKQRHEIALAILRQFSAFGELLLGNMHPLSRICGWLASVNESLFGEVVFRCLRSAGEQFEINLGPMHRCTLDSRLRYMSEVYRHRDANQNEVLHQSLLEKYERTLGAQDIRTLEIRSSLAFWYFERRDYAKAIEIGEYILANAHQVETPSHRIRLRVQIRYILAISQYMLGEQGLANANLREAIAPRESVFGRFDQRVILWSGILET